MVSELNLTVFHVFCVFFPRGAIGSNMVHARHRITNAHNQVLCFCSLSLSFLIDPLIVYWVYEGVRDNDSCLMLKRICKLSVFALIGHTQL